MKGRKKSENLYKEYKNEIILISTFFVSYIVFLTPINNIISKLLVNPVLKYVDAKAWYNDVFFWLYILYLIYSTFKNWKKLHYLNISYAFLFSLTLIYLINRFDNHWVFHETLLVKQIYYSDLLLFSSVSLVLLIFKTNFFSKKEKDNNKNLGFIVDKPVLNISDDRLQYASYAQSISEKISNTETDKSFAIGVNARWGTGKTSFLNFIKQELNKTDNDLIQIDFSPWNIDSPQAIITDFFETFEEKLEQYNSNISRHLNNYTRKLLALNEFDNTKPVYNFLTNLISSNKTLESLKHDIEKNISRIDRKIIVFIDDVDRLDNKEIIEILRIIRNTANFKNTFFLVAYDRNYLINALTAYNSYNKEGFLEKIFQLEINLPSYNPKELLDSLLENLLQYFPSRKSVIKEALLSTENQDFSDELKENISNMRDVVLLTNSLLINYENLRGNVNFKDLLLIEILRIKFSNIYELLKGKSLVFISENYNRKGCYMLTIDRESSYAYIETILDNNYLELNIDILNVDKIKRILNILFNKSNNYLSLCNISKYDNYFSYRLTEKTLDDNEFKQIRTQNLTKIKENISRWIMIGYEYDLLKRYYSINSYDNFEDYKKVVKSIIFLAESKSKKSNQIIGFGLNNLYMKCSYNDEIKTMGISSEKHKNFVMSCFNKMASYSDYKEEFLLYAKKEDPKSEYVFPINKNELMSLFKNSLIYYTSKYKIVKARFLDIARHNANKENRNGRTIHRYNNEIKSIIMEYLNSQKIDALIRLSITNVGQNNYALSNKLIEIFGHKTNFINYLQNRKENEKSKYYNEWIIFVNESNKKNLDQSIKFDFKTIKLSQK